MDRVVVNLDAVERTAVPGLQVDVALLIGVRPAVVRADVVANDAVVGDQAPGTKDRDAIAVGVVPVVVLHGGAAASPVDVENTAVACGGMRPEPLIELHDPIGASPGPAGVGR